MVAPDPKDDITFNFALELLRGTKVDPAFPHGRQTRNQPQRGS